MKRSLAAVLLALVGFVAALACTTGNDAVVPAPFAIVGATLESGNYPAWPDAGTAADMDTTPLTTAVLTLVLQLEAPPGSWTVSVQADGALSTTAVDGGAPVQRPVQASALDASWSTNTVVVPLYLVDPVGAAAIHVVFEQTSQDYLLNLQAVEPTFDFCSGTTAEDCSSIDGVDSGSDGGVDSGSDAGADTESDAGSGAGGEPGCTPIGGALPCTPSQAFCVPPRASGPAEGDLLFVRVGATPMTTQPWVANVTTQGSLEFAFDGGPDSVECASGDAGVTWLPLYVRSPGLGVVSGSIVPSVEAARTLNAAGPQIAIKSVQPVGDGVHLLITVCTGAATGSLVVGTNNGALFSAISPIGASPQCGEGYHGVAYVQWSGGTGTSVFTLMYQGGSGTVSQLLCAPATPAPPDAGPPLTALSAETDASTWAPPIELDGGPEPADLLVNTLFQGSDDGGPTAPLANAQISYIASAGSPGAGTILTDSNGQGFVNLVVPPEVTALAVRFSTRGQSTTLTFTEQAP